MKIDAEGAFLIALVVGLLGLIVYIIIMFFVRASQRRGALRKTIDELPDFKAEQSFVGEDGLVAIAIEADGDRIALATNYGQTVSVNVFSFTDLVACEVLENGRTTTSTSRTSQVGGALVGGLALGGVGAVIGGLSGSTRTSQKVDQIRLRITVDRVDVPNYELCFLDTIDAEKGGFLYSHAMGQVQHWHSVLSVLIRRADKAIAQRVGESLAPLHVADELTKLADLVDRGVLSREMFEQQKERLLGRH